MHTGFRRAIVLCQICALCLLCLGTILCSDKTDPGKDQDFVLSSETAGPRDLPPHYRKSEFAGRQKGDLFQISSDGSNVSALAEYVAMLPGGPFITDGKVYYYSGDMEVHRITCERQYPFTNRTFPGWPAVEAYSGPASESESSQAPASQAKPSVPKPAALWSAEERPPGLLQFRCDLDSGNGLYWGHIIQTFVLRHEKDDLYRLIFEYGHGSKHDDEITFPDLNRDGIPEVWILDRGYGTVRVIIEKRGSERGERAFYRRIFQYDIYRSEMKTCYGYDASLQLHNSGRTMPDLLLIATPLFNENGACWPAANSQEESRAYVHTQMNRIRGAYRFVYDGYAYAGSPELKQLHSEYE